MHVYLETDRLVLRRFTPDDLDAVEALDADPAVMRYITGGLPTPRDELRDDYLPSWLAYYDRGDRYGFWAAIEKRSGAFLGWFHLRPQDPDLDDEPRAGLPVVRRCLGPGLRDRRVDRPGPEGIRGARPTRVRDGDGRQQGLMAGDGEGRAAPRPPLPQAVALPDPGRRAG